MWFFGNGQNHSYLNSNSVVYGVVYAPGQPVTIQSNAWLYGALVGSQVTVMGNAIIHYDEALSGGCN